MPLYIDIHELGTVSVADVAKAHTADMEKQGKYGVEYIKYWVNESCGKVFCLVNAPNPEAARCVHQEAHGLTAGRIIEVQPEVAEGFIGGGPVNAAGAVLQPGNSGTLDTCIRTIVFTDIVGSTALTQQLGDEAVIALLDIHNKVVREALAALGGREVKHTGDGIMASFISAASAVKCAVRIQRELASQSQRDNVGAVKVRIGAAAGEPVEHQGDFFGSSVNLAARLCAYAAPDQILVSNLVTELCLGKGLRFRDLGEVALKGFELPMRAHAVE